MADYSIVLNAGEDPVRSATEGFFVSPVRQLEVGSSTLHYNPDTKEIFYSTEGRRRSQDSEGLPQVEGVNYDQVIPLLLQEAKELKATREMDATHIEALKAEAKELKAAREMDAIRIQALENKMENLVLELQQLVSGPAK